MSTNYTIRARRNFSDLIEKQNDEKIIKDDGFIKDLMLEESKRRQEFEYVPAKNDKASTKFNKNSITFRSRASTHDQESRTSYRRMLLGKSMEWANAPPFETPEAAQLTLRQPISSLETKYRNDAQLYTSVMGSSIKSSARDQLREMFAKNDKKTEGNGPIATYDGLAVPNTVANLQMSLDIHRIRMKTSQNQTRQTMISSLLHPTTQQSQQNCPTFTTDREAAGLSDQSTSVVKPRPAMKSRYNEDIKALKIQGRN